MNSKKITYFLIAALLVIWGMVFYRIFFHVNNDGIGDYQPMVARADTTVELQKDTFSIVARYRDPFLSGNYVVNPNPSPLQGKDKKQESTRRSLIKKLKWPVIEYGGIIKNLKKESIVALVTINSKNKLMYEGDEFEEIRLMKIYTDSIQVAYKDEEKTIVKD